MNNELQTVFKAIYDNCNLPEARCQQIAAAVVEQLEASRSENSQ